LRSHFECPNPRGLLLWHCYRRLSWILPVGSQRKCDPTESLLFPVGARSGSANFKNCPRAYLAPISLATSRSDLTGPIAGDDYTYRDKFDLSSTVLSPCGAVSILVAVPFRIRLDQLYSLLSQDTVLNIQSSLQVSNKANPAGSGYIATDSVSDN
jgi:hypothetical protein